ncbi:MAG: ABC1 kinase family protein [Marmoricola sp.]
MGLRIAPAHVGRYRQIGMLLLRHGRDDLVRATGLDATLDTDDSPPAEREAAARLADDLEAMGPTFIKLGQLLSSRVDLLSPAYLEALARLQDDVAPFPFSEVQEIVSAELGVRLSTVFPMFDETPLAAASLGQVHRATLRDGREVVVKVQRPGVREQVAEDLDVLDNLARFLDGHTDTGRRYGLTQLLEEFRKALVDELDYRREADNLVRIRDLVAEHPLLVVPEPHADLTTSRVLTMDYVAGEKVTDLGPLARLEVDGAALADQLFAAYLDQVLGQGLFHADPHPGNVLVTPDGHLVLLDVGMVARLAPAVREKLVKLFLALADGRAEEVTRIAITLGRPLSDFDEPAFGRAVADLVGRSIEASLADLDIGPLVLELSRQAADAGLRMEPELVMLGKTLLNLEQVASALEPEFDPRVALRRHLATLMKSSMETSPASLLSSMMEAKEFIEELPGRVNRAFDAVGEGHFELRVKAFDEDEFLRGLHKLANAVSAAVVLAAMILASAMLARPGSHGATTANDVALGVFIVAVLVSLAMLARIVLRSRKVHTDRRT